MVKEGRCEGIVEREGEKKTDEANQEKKGSRIHKIRENVGL